MTNLGCMKGRHPHLMGPEDAIHGGWQVLESSGYLNLWSPEGSTLRQEYLRFWNQNIPEHGAVLTLEGASQPVATIAATILWPRTCMAHHLGVDTHERKDRHLLYRYAKELYSALTYELERYDYIAMFMEADKRWNDFLYGSFCLDYNQPNDLLWLRNQVFRATTESHAPEASAVRPANQTDLVRLATVYSHTKSPLECEVMGLTVENLSAEGFSKGFACVGHERARNSFVYDSGGRVSWGMVCETGNEGVNVFGLLNVCWLTQINPCTPQESAQARRALLRYAAYHYAKAGKHNFLLMEPPEASHEDAVASGFQYVSDGSMWLSRSSVIPAWRTHLDKSLTRES